VWLGSLPAKLAPFMIVASLVIFVGGIITEGKLTLQTDPVQWVNQDSQNRKDVATLEERTDASSELGIFVGPTRSTRSSATRRCSGSRTSATTRSSATPTSCWSGRAS